MQVLMVALAGIIVIQAIIMIILWTSIGRAKTMYSESLNDRIEMQEEINRLTEEEVSDNYDDIPYVTEGGEELSLPTQP